MKSEPDQECKEEIMKLKLIFNTLDQITQKL